MKIRNGKDVGKDEWRAVQGIKLATNPWFDSSDFDEVKEIELDFGSIYSVLNDLSRRVEQKDELANQALLEKNRSQDLMIKYQTLSLTLSEALRREQQSE